MASVRKNNNDKIRGDVPWINTQRVGEYRCHLRVRNLKKKKQ